MADIAILVAEEYERRVKKGSRSREDGGGGGDGDDQLMVMIRKNKIDFNWMAEKIKNVQIVQLLEPKTQIGLAASDGFFSA
ncbi:hypothetical protein ACOSP7_021845 [Xanthoceras sorbifolium]